MKVSVLIITYNQEKVIAQAVNSVLMQQVNFPYEVVIGEDVSTDRTREIVLELQKQQPDKIRVMLRDPAKSERERAQGLGGKTNFMQGLRDCRGEYIALLDGDDYWTDIHKLRRQVEFLDTHPDFAISCHNVKVIFEGMERGSLENLCPADQKEVLTIEDLFLLNFIPTCSTVFRRGLFGELPDWFYTLKIGDWPLHIMNASYGKIGYIDEVMAAYRFHQGGYWSSKTEETQCLEVIKMLDYLDAYLGRRYRKQIKDAKAKWYAQLGRLYCRVGEIGQGSSFVKLFSNSSFRLRRGLLSLWLRSRMPVLYKAIRRLRNFAGSVTGRRSRVDN